MKQLFKKTKLISILLVAMLAFFYSACKDSTEIVDEKGSKQDNPTYDLEEIQAAGKLRALIDNSSTSYFVYKGTPMGFEYELLSRFAKHIDVDLEVIPVKDMNEVIPGLRQMRGDIIAANFTITKERADKVSFSESLIASPQVLVQNTDNEIIESPSEIDGHEVYVRKSSSFYSRLQNLSEEIGGKVHIREVAGNVSVEKLIEEVSQGNIPLTVADEHVAKINQAFYPNLHIKTPISLEQQMAWAIRKESPNLLIAINQWLEEFKKTVDFRVIYLKYFGDTKLYRSRVKSKLFTAKSGQISPYDKFVKTQSKQIGWDWRLISALIYQESQFDPHAQSWAGAQGLMQLMPETAQSYGVDSTSGVSANIAAGIKYLSWLDKQFTEKVSDSIERRKFVMAAYNVGLGHVFDAIRLAEKNDLDPQAWEGNVAEMLLKKAEPDYYTDEVCYYGYCRGSEPYAYVNQIMGRYLHYKNMTESFASNN
jgi:membrane-bound lytic murein transglycosylase F